MRRPFGSPGRRQLVPGLLPHPTDRQENHDPIGPKAHPHHQKRADVGLRQLQLFSGQLHRKGEEVHRAVGQAGAALRGQSGIFKSSRVQPNLDRTVGVSHTGSQAALQEDADKHDLPSSRTVARFAD